MIGSAIPRAALATAALLLAAQAHAGSEVPPPRAAEPIRSAMRVEPRTALRAYLSDRYVPVLGVGGLAPCGRRAIAAANWVAEYGDRDVRSVATDRDDDFAWSGSDQDDFPMGEEFR